MLLFFIIRNEIPREYLIKLASELPQEEYTRICKELDHDKDDADELVENGDYVRAFTLILESWSKDHGKNFDQVLEKLHNIGR